jgi:hypothetical protein
LATQFPASYHLSYWLLAGVEEVTPRDRAAASWAMPGISGTDGIVKREI